MLVAGQLVRLVVMLTADLPASAPSRLALTCNGQSLIVEI